MCRRTTCRTCDKPSWAGCGAHVEQVLGDVPAADRCQCQSTGGGSAGEGGDRQAPRWLQRILGGR